MEQTRSWIPVALAASVAALLYYSGVLSFLFAVPIQVILVRYGKQTAVQGALAAAALMVLGRFVLAGVSAAELVNAMMPIGMLAAVLVFNLWRGVRWSHRLTAAAVVAVVGSYPALRILIGTGAEAVALRDQLAGAMQMFGVGVDSVALIEYVRRTVVNSVGGAMIAAVAATWWLGTSIALRPTGAMVALVAARVDDRYVWLLIGGLGTVVAGWLFDINWLLVALGWTAAAIAAFLFGVQGVGSLQYLVLTKTGKPHLTRLVITFTMVALIVPGLNVAALFGLPLLGVSELWVNYRRRRNNESHSQ